MNFSVIIPSRNAENLFPCIAAVKQHEPDARIIVVDDGLSAIPDGVEVIQGVKPFVFARNVNLGILAAANTDSDGVVILNDDALLQTPGGFSVMAQACEDYPDFGLIGATCNNVGNPNQHRRDIGLRNEPRMVCFVAVYIPMATFDLVGLLDERYTEYGADDDDFSFEVRKAGLKIGIHDGCYVDHGSLNSSYRGEAGAGGDFRHNLKLFIAKWGVDNWGHSKETSQFADLF